MIKLFTFPDENVASSFIYYYESSKVTIEPSVFSKVHSLKELDTLIQEKRFNIVKLSSFNTASPLNLKDLATRLTQQSSFTYFLPDFVTTGEEASLILLMLATYLKYFDNKTLYNYSSHFDKKRERFYIVGDIDESILLPKMGQ
jgi:hypothetical protein